MCGRRRGISHRSGVVLPSGKGKGGGQGYPPMSGNVYHVGASSHHTKLPRSTSAPKPKWSARSRQQQGDRHHKPHLQQNWKANCPTTAHVIFTPPNADPKSAVTGDSQEISPAEWIVRHIRSGEIRRLRDKSLDAFLGMGSRKLGLGNVPLVVSLIHHCLVFTTG